MGKVLFVDPNPKGLDVVQHEDLSIFVELITTKKQRSEINIDGPAKTVRLQKGGQKIPVKFLKGTEDDNGKSHLTTHYTEITTKFGNDNLDLETFGITSIDIDFNSSYTPLIKINFTDIRGRLFEMGENSPYNVFFNLPYPIFELTIKGYFGKAVTYCLHLTKFSGKLNDDTGNFEIQCDFVGYTYAFLADMLMGYLRGIAETDIAKNKIAEAKEKFLGRGEVFLSFNELAEKIKSLNKEITKLKSDDTRVAELAIAEDVLIKVAKLKDDLRKLLSNITGIKNVNDKKTIELYNDNRFALVRKLDSKEDKNGLVKSDILKYIEDHNEWFKEKVEDINTIITNNNFTLDTNVFILNANNYGDGIRKIDFVTDAFSGDTTDIDVYKNQKGSKNANGDTLTTIQYVLNLESEEDYQDFRRKIISIPPSKINDNQEMMFFDLQKMFTELDSINDKLRNSVKASKEALADELIDKIEVTLGVEYNGEIVRFKPTIKNMIRILTEHVHILMKCIKEVAEQVKTSIDNNTRQTQLNGLVIDKKFDLASDVDPQCGFGQISKSETNTTINEVLPFPDYKERERGTFEDKWIGNKAPTMPEVDFIEQLLEGLIQAKKKDQDLLDELQFGEDEWYPINPFDTKFMTDFENPWKIFSNSNDPDEVIRHMLLRAGIFLGYSNKTLSNAEIDVMAKLEANNAYNSIDNSLIRRSLTRYHEERSPANIARKILELAGPSVKLPSEPVKSWQNNGDVVNKKQIFGTHKYNANSLGFISELSIVGPLVQKVTNGVVNLALTAIEWTTGLRIPEFDTNQTVTMAEFRYIPHIRNASSIANAKKGIYDDSIKYYLPLSSGIKKDRAFFNGDSLITTDGKPATGLNATTLEDRIALREAGNIFFGSYIGGNSAIGDKPDDGSTTIEFITKSRYNKTQGQYPTYADGLFDSLEFNNNQNIANTSKLDFTELDKIPEDGMKTFSGMFAGRWKTHEFFEIVLPTEYEGFGNTIPSWVMFYQNTTSNRPIFTSLRRVNESNGIVQKTISDISDPDTTKTVQGIQANNKKIKASNFKFEQKNLYSKRSAKHFGKTIGSLLEANQSGINADISLPYLNFRMYSPSSNSILPDVNTVSDLDNTQFSTLGSDLYYQQTVEGKAYLFLHSLPWNGMVYNFGEGFFGTWGNSFSNLFNAYDTCGVAGEEIDADVQCNRGGGLFTHHIQHMFNQRAGFIEAPSLWIAFVGSILWRYRETTDPIIWEKNGYNLIPLSPKKSSNNSINNTPNKNQYCLPNISTNEVMGFISATNEFPIAQWAKDGKTGAAIAGLANLLESDKTYVDLERPLDRLPDALANKFITFFKEFANGKDFEGIRIDYDMFLKTDANGNYERDANGKLVDIDEDERIRLWLHWNDRLESNEGSNIVSGVVGGPNNLMGFSSDGTTYIGDEYINPNLSKNYIVACGDDKYATYFYDKVDNQGVVLWGPNNPMYKQYRAASKLNTNAERVAQAKSIAAAYDKGSPFNFFLEMRDTTSAQKNLFNKLTDTRIIVNSSWRLWASNAETPLSTQTMPFRFDINKLVKYVNTFCSEYHRLVDENEKGIDEEEENIKKDLFKTLDADDIKLNLYKNIKSIYDKWIPGSKCELELCGNGMTDDNEECPNLIDTFRFIDRAYNDIGNEFLINPIKMVLHMVEDYNISFYDYLARNLVDNNFDFIPLPTFINYNKQEEIEEVFKPEPFNSVEYESGPQFICMYIGERSKNLNLGEQSAYKNDGFSINPNNNCLPSDFNGDSISGTTSTIVNNFIPAFRVAYGDQNQSIFTNFKLDQSEFTETDESLQIIDEISSDHGPNNPSSGGQNLFNVFRTRSYSATIDSMGNAQIQPFMYFELDNVPMFAGAYTIIHVKHTLKPNNMMTTFKGVRVRKSKTKMVEKSTVFMNLIGSLSDVDTEGIDLDGLQEAETFSEGGRGSGRNNYEKYNGKHLEFRKDAPAWAGCITYKIKDNAGLKIQVNDTTRIRPYCIKEVGKFIEYVGLKWNTYANTKLFSDVIYYNDLSRYGGGFLAPHATHKVGVAMDFRPIRNDKQNSTTSFTSGKYNQTETINLLKLFLDEALKNKGYRDPKNSMVDVIYFNDRDVIDAFKNYKGYGRNMVVYSDGHDDHIHIKFNLPDVVEDDKDNNYQICEERLASTTGNGIGHLNDLPPILTSLGYKKGTLEHRMALTIARKEGYGNNDETVRPRRNNNPGNLTGTNFKDIDPFVTIEQAPEPIFAKFSSPEKGAEALVTKKIIGWANGDYPPTSTNGNNVAFQNKWDVPQSVRGIAGKNIPMTFEQFVYTYAPPNQNNTEKYLNGILADLRADGINVNRNSKIKDYLS